MADDKFPINNDYDFTHTVLLNDVAVNLTQFDWYGVKWFYRNLGGGKVDIAAYDIAASETGFTANLEDVDAANGVIKSHIQRAEMSIPVGVKIYWQVYTKKADAAHDTDFHGAYEEVRAGVSVDADSI